MVAEQAGRPAPIPDVPEPLAALATTCLRVDPAERPSSAGRLAAYLRGWLVAGEDRATRSAPSAPGHVAPPPAPVPGPGMTTAAPPGISLPIALLVVRRAARCCSSAALGSSPVGPSGLLAAFGPPRLGRRREPRPAATPHAHAPPHAPARPRRPAPTPRPTPTPVPTTLSITAPKDGALVKAGQLTVKGTAPPRAEISRDLLFGFSDRTSADAKGNWTMKIDLAPGDNVLTFRIVGRATAVRTIHVFYQP